MKRLSVSDPEVKLRIKGGYRRKLLPAAIAEEWEDHLKLHPRKPEPLSASELDMQRRRAEHERWMEDQKNKKAP